MMEMGVMPSRMKRIDEKECHFLCSVVVATPLDHEVDEIDGVEIHEVDERGW